MKSNSFWGFAFNPFTRIAGWQAFLLGLVFVAASGTFGTMSRVAFDGVLDVHTGGNLTYGLSFMMLAIDIVSVVIIMWLTGVIISRTVRFVDILGTMTLARAPLLIAALVGLTLPLPPVEVIMLDPSAVFKSWPMIVFGVVAGVTVIWHVALMYNAMRVSCGVRGAKLTVAFIFALIVAEALSKVAITIAIKHLFAI
ncbi:hypothetical protein LJC45_06250 [Alistipes sp. OttesenSCG-928-B03]|nr:hypothetical protein [Alistipes sp. OttesenSCG-928-B03]